MDQLTLDIDELTAEQVAELLRIVQDMRAAHSRKAGIDPEADPERTQWDEALHAQIFARTARQGNPEQEAAYDVWSDVVAHGHQIGRDWAPLLIALAKRKGEPLDRDRARQMVTVDPRGAVHALRGLKQAFGRACAKNPIWAESDTYQPHYDDEFSGVSAISLGAEFSEALLAMITEI